MIDRLGGAARIRGCGEAVADNDLEIQTLLAYDLSENVNRIGYTLPQPGHPDNPIVVFTPLRAGGWKVGTERQAHGRPVSGCAPVDLPRDQRSGRSG